MTAYRHGTANNAPIGSPASVALPDNSRNPTRDDVFAAPVQHVIPRDTPVAERPAGARPSPEILASVPELSEQTGS